MSGTERHKVTITDGSEEGLVAEPEEIGESEEQAAESLVAESDIDSLLAELEAQKKKTEEEHNRYLRALADFSNFKRRQEERESSLRQFATKELVLKILGVVDDFERAISASEETGSYESLRSGLEMTARKLQDVLTAEGVQPIDAVGQEFDPNFHEAVMRVEDSDLEENTVVSELQKGYTIGSEVIRPAMVTVAVKS